TTLVHPYAAFGEESGTYHRIARPVRDRRRESPETGDRPQIRLSGATATFAILPMSLFRRWRVPAMAHGNRGRERGQIYFHSRLSRETGTYHGYRDRQPIGLAGFRAICLRPALRHPVFVTSAIVARGAERQGQA
ncbi:hypothetical protein, partial [Thiocapsa sp.]|uniref:hypothetical protein n=1 Tax=Thiocapsa sp. TaxID=2024551 RepID=UPI0035944868